MSTIKQSVKISGHGIHSGLPVNMVINPSDTMGIFFRRVDLPTSKLIPARFDNVCDTKMRNTTIGDLNGAHVKTIEHVMAALFIAGVDSAIIDIDGPETPICDGSAVEFYNAIILAGVDGNITRRIVVKRPVVAYMREMRRTLPLFMRMRLFLFDLFSGRRADGYVKLSPANENILNINATLVYREKIIGNQTYSYSFDGSDAAKKDFVQNVARARTFGKFSEWEYLKSHGMARGANETNIIALNDNGDATLNKTFWPDEFVRHKIIDAIGDMFTSGGMIVGNMVSYKGSHGLNNFVLKKLFSNSDNYDIVDMQ